MGGPPVSAEAIFVFAGRPHRKRHGIALWRRGVAPVLILSVARFEWRGVPGLGLPEDGGLRGLVDETYYKRGHFFVTLGPSGARARFVPPRFLGTRREAIGLAEEVRAKGYRSLLVVSSPPHLRRARLAVRRALRGQEVRVDYTATTDEGEAMSAAGWWRTAPGRRYVAGELVKLALYRMLPR